MLGANEIRRQYAHAMKEQGMNRRNPTGPTIALAVMLGISAISLNGCVGVAVGGGATAATAAAQERGFRTAVNDTVIRARINDLWFTHSVDLYKDVSLQIVEGRVLLTGQVPNAKVREDAVRLTWKAKGVREVINEIQVTSESGIVSYSRDVWITAQFKSKMVLDKQVSSINYSVETVGGIVYLIGIAQNQAELDRVVNHARNLKYVRRVVSYVLLKTDPRRGKS